MVRIRLGTFGRRERRRRKKILANWTPQSPVQVNGPWEGGLWHGFMGYYMYNSHVPIYHAVTKYMNICSFSFKVEESIYNILLAFWHIRTLFLQRSEHRCQVAPRGQTSFVGTPKSTNLAFNPCLQCIYLNTSAARQHHPCVVLALHISWLTWGH